MGKPTICIGENKDADQFSAFVFATRIVQFIFYLNPKVQASSSFLCLYGSVCVRPGRKPHCWYFHETAQFIVKTRDDQRLQGRAVSAWAVSVNFWVGSFGLGRWVVSANIMGESIRP